MPVPFKIKLVKIGGSIRMTIPKPIVDYIGLEEGQTVQVLVNDHEIIVKKS